MENTFKIYFHNKKPIIVYVRGKNYAKEDEYICEYINYDKFFFIKKEDLIDFDIETYHHLLIEYHANNLLILKNKRKK